jgi:hypothetical protein
MKLKDVMHLYIGCDCLIGDLNWKPETNLQDLAPIVDPDFGKPIRTKLDCHIIQTFAHITHLLLRPIESMTGRERKEYINIGLESSEVISLLSNPSASGQHCVNQFVFLLSRGFDLFSLIPSGQAIDATKTGK